jgi:hypothetical protein
MTKLPNTHAPKSDFMSIALIKIFRPLVRLLLRFHIPYKACAEALKWTYVDVATQEFALGAQKQTKSRIAVITGLTRIEVEKLQREGAKTTGETTQLFNRAARVLSAWEHDPDYIGADGKPKLLSLDQGAISIASLVAKYSGGTTLHAVLDELLEKGNVCWHEGEERYELIDAHFLVFRDSESELAILASSTADLLGTIERNIRPQQTDRRLQAYVDQIDIPTHQIPLVREYVKRKGNEFLDELDQFLHALAAAPPAQVATETPLKEPVEPSNCPRLGVGVYYFQDDPPIPSAQMDSRGRLSARKKDALAAKSTAHNRTKPNPI